MKRKFVILLHVLVWLLVWINDFMPKYLNNASRAYQAHPEGPTLLFNQAMVSLSYMISAIVIFYALAYLIAPLYLRKRWIHATLWLTALVLFIPLYRYLMEFHVLLPVFGYDNYFGKVPEAMWYIQNSILYATYSYLSWAVIYFFVREWYQNNKKKKEIEKEKIRAELSFLRSQINPHFLFNAMNDIYSLTLIKSDEAPQAILKLSELLRYMLKGGTAELAPLEAEIDYLNNVVELWQIGEKGNSFVDFKVSGLITNQQIAPLILINFLENAFKHGITKDQTHPIQIDIDIDNLGLSFLIVNRKNSQLKDSTGGIGLANVKRRLDLIYPDRHVLDISDEAGTFTVKLRIEWK